jgi:hypothetical protein
MIDVPRCQIMRVACHQSRDALKYNNCVSIDATLQNDWHKFLSSVHTFNVLRESILIGGFWNTANRFGSPSGSSTIGSHISIHSSSCMMLLPLFTQIIIQLIQVNSIQNKTNSCLAGNLSWLYYFNISINNSKIVHHTWSGISKEMVGWIRF